MTIKPLPASRLESLHEQSVALATPMSNSDEETVGEHLAYAMRQVIEWVYEGDATRSTYHIKVLHRICAVAWTFQPHCFKGQSVQKVFSQRGYAGKINKYSISKYARELREEFGITQQPPAPPPGKESFLDN